MRECWPENCLCSSNVSWDIEELLGWPCLLFLLKFPPSQFGPVWNLELPNLEVKEAVFLTVFSSLRNDIKFLHHFRQTPLSCTLKYYNKIVAIAYFKSNTSKDRHYMRQSFFVKDTAGAVACEQASVRGKKIARRGKGKGKEGFSLFLLLSSPLDWRPVHRLQEMWFD